MYEPKVGDIVSLKSNPEHVAVVAGYEVEKKMYNLVWIKPDGDWHGIMIVAAALQKVKTGPTLEDTDRSIALLQERLTNALARVEQGEAALDELKTLKEDNALACMRASTALETFIAPGTLASNMVGALSQRLATTIKEANEQIARVSVAPPA